MLFLKRNKKLVVARPQVLGPRSPCLPWRGQSGQAGPVVSAAFVHGSDVGCDSAGRREKERTSTVQNLVEITRQNELGRRETEARVPNDRGAPSSGRFFISPV
jgi:hypothetical protein